MEIIWKKIPSLNYEVSNTGLVRSVKTLVEIKQRVSNSGYCMVSLYFKNKKRFNKQVHRLVAEAFIVNPENKSQVNHVNSLKSDNTVDNLEWCTPKENMSHYYKNGGVKFNNQTYKGRFGKDHNRSVKIECNGVLYNGYSEASRKTGVAISTIHYRVKNNITKTELVFQLAKI